MQKFLLNLAGLGLLTTVLFFSSCDEDPIVTDPLGPAIQFLADTDLLSGDSELIVGESFTVKIKLDKGDTPLKSVEMTEAGTKLEPNRFSINAGAIDSNNAFLITGADVDGVTYSITIFAGAQVVGDITLYDFIVTDEGGKTAHKDIQITATALPGTPISMSITGVLLNQAGPSGTGGLDLDNGTGTGSSDVAAELRDLGIDCTVASGENWRAQFGTVNGAIMVKVDATQVENFTFDSADKTEVIADAYNALTVLADGISTSASCNETAVTNVSGDVLVGDMFIIFSNDTHYLIKVDAVNFMSASNGDNYEFSIKY